MATNRTFTMIKPDAVEKNYIGGILKILLLHLGYIDKVIVGCWLLLLTTTCY